MTAPRILFLTPGCFDKGGISRYSRYQIRALRELFGPERVRVLSLMGPDEHAFEESFDVHWSGAPGNQSQRARFAARALLEVVAFRPDVIHIAHVNYAVLANALAGLCGAGRVLNVYGLELWSGLSAARRSAVEKMDLILSDCHFTANYAVSESLHAVRPTVIWDCVDLARFSPGDCPTATRAKYGLPDKASHPVILTLGRLTAAAAHKGYDRLIRAFARMPPTQARPILIIAGRGELRPDLEALARRENVAGRVHFTGPIDEVDLADVYRAASVFSLVSDRGVGRGEGLPLTPLEAMACGVPIIVGDQDGSREAVVDATNGFAIDPFDLDSHAALLAALANAPALRETMSQGARRAAEAAFGYEAFRAKHLQCYRRLLRADADWAEAPFAASSS